MIAVRSTFRSLHCLSKQLGSTSSLFPKASAAHSTSVQAQHLEIKEDVNKNVAEKVSIPDPFHEPDFFNVKSLFTVQDLFDARVHFGHTMGTLNDHMRQFVLGHRLGTLIFDLDQTVELLQEALNFIAHIAFRQGIILFIGRYKQHSHLIEKTAMECGEYSHTRFWLHGTFTDPRKFGLMTRLPDLTIFFNTLDSVFEIHRAVLESNKLLIPSVGVVDTNCFPNYITYPIPGNDDSPESAELYCKLFKAAVLLGKAKRKEYVEKYGSNFEEQLLKNIEVISKNN